MFEHLGPEHLLSLLAARGSGLPAEAFVFEGLLLVSLLLFLRHVWRTRRRTRFVGAVENSLVELADANERLWPWIMELADRLGATPSDLAAAAQRLGVLDRRSEAHRLAKLSLERDPLAPGFLHVVARVVAGTGDRRFAVEAMRCAARRRPLTWEEVRVRVELLQADGEDAEALLALASSPPNADVRSRLTRALKDPDDGVRTAAAVALARWGRLIRQAEPDLVEAMSGLRSAVRTG